VLFGTALFFVVVVVVVVVVGLFLCGAWGFWICNQGVNK